MENKNKSKGSLSRRKFLGSTATIAAFSMVPLNFSLKSTSVVKDSAETTPNSNFGGVQIGAITYSWRSMPGGVENIIKYCKEAVISSVELMSNDVEEFLGAPKNPMMGMFGPPPAAPAAGAPPPPPPPPPPAPAPGAPAVGAPPAPQRRELTQEQKDAIAKFNKDIREWRLALPISKYEEVRKMFDNAGIKIHIVKFSPARWSDEEIDYAFEAAKVLGAKGVTEEIGEDAVKKLGPVAEKHGMYAIFHNHMQFEKPGFSYDPFLAVSPAVMMNFDAGHFFGSTGIHPNTIIEKYHDRIVSIHLKDKTGPKIDPANTNQVWGQGEVPIADILLLIKKNKWPINCDIELEYDIKPWSDAVKEVKTCVQYARQILM
ncbi:MAG: sugar phosphate isomerase/epimerase [Bacteroidia bacterium]|nr:sugar phosphate isomerase/epimerase [Bacteroidia bacterium]